MRSIITSRLTRAGFGLMAIWCLGCTSFDELLSALIGRDAPCAGCVMEDAPNPPSSADASTVSSAKSDDTSEGCGCDHCIAVESDAIRIAIAPHLAPETVHHTLGSAPSVSREPLVPPPIATIAI